MKNLRSRTVRLKNAIVILHEYSAGTAILHIDGTSEDGDHAAIWVNLDELDDLANMLRDFAAASKEPV